MLTTIPFSGFYESIHSQQVDDAVESLIQNSSGNGPTSDAIAENFWSCVNYRQVFLNYSKEYVADFNTYFNKETGVEIKLEWESMSSPREYNFSTDRIFATISTEDVKKLFAACKPENLDKIAKERFTSYDGFISYYSPNWRSWGDVEEWDYNQVGTLLMAVAVGKFDEDWEYNLVGEWECNGVISNWVYAALDKEGDRLVKISGYLRTREERKWRTR